MNPGSQILINLTEDEEMDRLERLSADCDDLLYGWRANTWSSFDISSDAVVAIMELQRKVDTRRAYLLGRLQKDNLPF